MKSWCQFVNLYISLPRVYMVLGDAVSKLETFVSITWSLFTLEAPDLVKWPVFSTWSLIWCCQFIDWFIHWMQFPVQFRNDNIDISVKSEIIDHVTSAFCTYSVSRLCRRYTDLFLESILAIFVLASSICTLFSRRMFITFHDKCSCSWILPPAGVLIIPFVRSSVFYSSCYGVLLH